MHVCWANDTHSTICNVPTFHLPVAIYLASRSGTREVKERAAGSSLSGGTLGLADSSKATLPMLCIWLILASFVKWDFLNQSLGDPL